MSFGIQIHKYIYDYEDPGFDTLGQCEGQFFCLSDSESTLDSCRLVYNAGPPFVCTVRTQTCAHVKDPIATSHKTQA